MIVADCVSTRAVPAQAPHVGEPDVESGPGVAGVFDVRSSQCIQRVGKFFVATARSAHPRILRWPISLL